MHRVTITPVTEKEISWFQWGFLIGWVLVINFTAWDLWATNTVTRVSVIWPTLATIISIPFGWFLGYRHLIGPIFVSRIIRHKS